MINVRVNQSSQYSNKDAVAYSFGQISLVTAYQTFTFLVFTFYYSVIRINVALITIGFLIWSVWNAFNDPIMGYISDRINELVILRFPLQ